MSVLYPRLLPGETDRRFRMLAGASVGDHESMVADHSPRAVYAATGGRRVTRVELGRLRGALVHAAREQGFPNSSLSVQRALFDRTASQILHEESLMDPGEAAQRQVWAFIALVLLPDVCAWRWPAGTDGRFVADRFKGTDLTRHALARLWTRAHILHDPEADDPYHLLNVLGEADLDQVMARRAALACTPTLVRAIVREHRDDRAEDGIPSRTILRDSLMRLLRLTAFMDLDSATDAELGLLVRRARSEARIALDG